MSIFPVLTVLCSGSHTVAFSALAPQMGSLVTGCPVPTSRLLRTGLRGRPDKNCSAIYCCLSPDFGLQSYFPNEVTIKFQNFCVFTCSDLWSCQVYVLQNSLYVRPTVPFSSCGHLNLHDMDGILWTLGHLDICTFVLCESPGNLTSREM